MDIKWDGCSEDRDLCKERDSEYERFDDQHLERVGYVNGEWVEDQLDNPVALDVILYLRLERPISHPVLLTYCFATHPTIYQL